MEQFVTYENMFSFVLVLIGLASLIITINNKQKKITALVVNCPKL